MTLTPEQIKEAVELADGFAIGDDGKGFGLTIEKLDGTEWTWCFGSLDSPPPFLIAALASQLISQVDAMEPKVYTSVCRGWTAIRDTDNKQDLVAKYGPNRDENSILACTEFLRELAREALDETEGEQGGHYCGACRARSSEECDCTEFGVEAL